MGECEKVYLVEDDMFWGEQAQVALRKAGHTVVRRSYTFQEAIRKIPVAIKKGMTVAVIDGNLGHNRRIECEDGQEIAKVIREQSEGVTIVAFTSSNEKIARYGDYYAGKDPERLAAIVTRIPRKKPQVRRA